MNDVFYDFLKKDKNVSEGFKNCTLKLNTTFKNELNRKSKMIGLKIIDSEENIFTIIDYTYADNIINGVIIKNGAEVKEICSFDLLFYSIVKDKKNEISE